MADEAPKTDAPPAEGEPISPAVSAGARLGLANVDWRGRRPSVVVVTEYFEG